ncbi:hypothetical protein SAMN05421666_1968 [Roseovarius nanhaiticus]|uniref:Uncharacterized protein n=2 Tax=Roseovarius nanhaiticus TaxID=573024 RepID=A0A1N7GE54_9RHOB|nr:hypothetical protein SAMN05216208_0167 [Roseovarius nanhaiticus]SIS10828.1 hypothetical protein SAMN05421666_1968 [Roseovarius nanhaiticus]
MAANAWQPRMVARALGKGPDMNSRWLLRMTRWAQNPPSAGRVKFVFAIIGICVALYAVERIWGWPEALSPDRSLQRGYKP